VFAIGIISFAVVSLLLSLVPNLIALNALRFAQGIAAALAYAGGTAALSQEFHGPARIRAFSMIGTSFGLGLAFGPSLAGWLVESFGWRSMFLASVTIALLAIVFGVPRLRESRDPNAAGLDWPGTLTSAVMLALLTIGVLGAPDRGWGDPWTIAALLGAAVFLVVFVWVEMRSAHPMLDLSLFRYRSFVGVQLLPIGTGFCYLPLIVILPVSLIGIHGYSALEAGLLMLALSAPMLVVPFLSALLSHRVSAGALCGVGLLLAAGGLVWMGTVVSDPTSARLIGPMLVIGVGSAIPWGLMDGLAISVVPKERAGMAIGVFGACRVSGESIAIAVAAVTFAGLIGLRLSDVSGDHLIDAGALSEVGQRLATGDARPAQALLSWLDPTTLMHGYDTAFAWLMYVLAGATVVIAGVAYLMLGNASAHEPVAMDDVAATEPRDDEDLCPESSAC
jgi:MFS family permease